MLVTIGTARRDLQCQIALDRRFDGLIEKSPRPVNSSAVARKPDALSPGLL
jgi:hypothetical protein